MPGMRRAASEAWHQRKQGLLERLHEETGVEFVLDARRGARAARGSAGTLFLPAASESQSDRWWLGVNERAFLATEDARGVVLLCESVGAVLDFWFSANEIRELLPRLSASKNDERKFNVVRRRDRYWLQVPGEDEIEITAKRGDTSWLTSESVRREGAARGKRQGSSPQTAEYAFFARVRKARLEPLDPVPLEEGAVVIVRVMAAPAVPRRTALRQIVAAGGPEMLPSDFAEQHDHYIRGMPRR